VLTIEAGYDAIRFKATATPAVILNLSTSPFLDFILEFDTETGIPVRFVPSNVTTSRVDYALQFLAHMDTTAAIPMITQIATQHEAHFVRWTTLRCITAMDPTVAAPLLSEAAETDAHPHVRHAAAQALTLISSIAV
jgi:HEAT repeat protein